MDADARHKQAVQLTKMWSDMIFTDAYAISSEVVKSNSVADELHFV